MPAPGGHMFRRHSLIIGAVSADGRPHVGDKIRQWQGDSRGHFVGNTLVVDTVNFTNKQDKSGVGSTIPGGVPMGNIHLTEYFVPVSAKRIEYYAIVDDPKTWTRPW